MIIDCISDLHGYYPKLEGGDLLIVAGDLTARDTLEEHLEFCDWILKQNYKKVVWIAGNHDNRYQFYGLKGFFLSPDQRDKSHISYLCDSGTEFEGLKIWGSPWTKTFPGMNPHCKAFTCDTEEELAEKWALIPDGIDILITHSPPYGILDEVQRYSKAGKYTEHVGSESLALRIEKMKNPPRLWVFGHIHEAYGRDKLLRQDICLMVNASHVNEVYDPVNKPVRIEL